jgi:hypothetical protein
MVALLDDSESLLGDAHLFNISTSNATRQRGRSETKRGEEVVILLTLPSTGHHGPVEEATTLIWQNESSQLLIKAS